MAEEFHKPALMIKVLDFLWAGPEESLFWPDDVKWLSYFDKIIISFTLFGQGCLSTFLKRQVPIWRQMPFEHNTGKLHEFSYCVSLSKKFAKLQTLINFDFLFLLFVSLKNLPPLWPYCSRLAAILRQILTLLINKKIKPPILSLTLMSFSPQNFPPAKNLCSVRRVKPQPLLRVQSKCLSDIGKKSDEGNGSFKRKFKFWILVLF